MTVTAPFFFLLILSNQLSLFCFCAIHSTPQLQPQKLARMSTCGVRHDHVLMVHVASPGRGRTVAVVSLWCGDVLRGRGLYLDTWEAQCLS